MPRTDCTTTDPDDKPRTHLVGSLGTALHDFLGGCPHARTLVAHSALFEHPILVALACKRWGCCHCGRIRVAQLSTNVKRAKPNKLITLTVDPKFFESPREAYDKTRRKLCDFNKAIRKEVGEFEYLRVLEITKAGWPHYHMLCRSKYIPKSVISDVWAKLTGATIVDVKALKNCDNVYAYVTKYLGKQTYIPWTNRRVSWSRNFIPPAVKKETDSWELDNKTFIGEHPVTVIEQSYWTRELQRIGPYAWELVPIQGSLGRSGR